jgi:hypothetical protein
MPRPTAKAPENYKEETHYGRSKSEAALQLGLGLRSLHCWRHANSIGFRDNAMQVLEQLKDVLREWAPLWAFGHRSPTAESWDR